MAMVYLSIAEKYILSDPLGLRFFIFGSFAGNLWILLKSFFYLKGDFFMDMKNWTLKKLVYTALLSAVAGVLMSLEFPLPLMPPFYKIDFSATPAIIATFMMGPASGICVELVKILIKLVSVGTTTMYVGEFANVISTFVFILPLWYVYKVLGKGKKAMIASLLLSVVLCTACSCVINAFITLPLYAKAMGQSLDAVVKMVAAVNPAITNLTTFIILATIPFNIIKCGINCIVGYYLFTRLIAAKVMPKFESKKAEE